MRCAPARMAQMNFAFGHELIVDLFAGGGGASLGIEQAFGRPVDIAVNHSADAIAMHQANHPQTRHLQCDVFEVNPLQATGGRQVGLLWASPDCKHFSKAKGGKPRSKKIRSLAWVVVKWATLVRPRVIMLENVEEFVTWGPLGPDNQPCPQRKGQTFRRWVGQLRKLGYVVEWRELRACDYGTPTIRKRFFLIARCDGLPIRWPAPTHGKPDSIEVRNGKLLPWRTAAVCIDWSLPCHSIFLTKEEGRALGVKRPLAEATMRRIAKGVQRFVLDAAHPFIVNTRNGERSGQEPRVRGVDEPAWTVTAQGSQGALAVPVLTEHANASRAASWTPAEPLRTQCAEVKGGHFALATAFLTKYRADNAGSSATAPFPTITANGDSDRPGGNPPLALIGAHLLKQYGGNESPGWPLDKPISTVTSQDHHHLVRSFMVKFYSCGGQHAACDDPMHTVPTRDRMGLVTVDGSDYAIADIGLRMLAPRELFRAQGFPENYVIDVGANGRKLPKDAQVRACGNSVCPPLARALVEANVGEIRELEEAAAA
jgi:DNA (cytosine-5)-methyltransferase 1